MNVLHMRTYALDIEASDTVIPKQARLYAENVSPFVPKEAAEHIADMLDCSYAEHMSSFVLNDPANLAVKLAADPGSLMPKDHIQQAADTDVYASEYAADAGSFVPKEHVQ
jgi:hypothetical protein